MDRISESRSRLFAALTPLLPADRVSKYVPRQVVSPCIWIERHSWSSTREQNVAMVALSWRIVVATDANDDQAQLDVLSSKVYDVVARAKFRPQFADFQSVDVGGVQTTALVVTVDELVATTTFCLPPEPALAKELVTV